MHRYSFMGRNAMQGKNISEYVKERYGMEIESLLEGDRLYKETAQILENAIDRKYINQLYEIGKGKEETNEIKFVKDTISDIINQIGTFDFFIPDLSADCFMGLLYSDEDCYVRLNDEMEAGWGPTDKESREKYVKKNGQISDNLVRILDAQEHYPYAKYEDEEFSEGGIRGGCKEYHMLMMSQKNINIFAINVLKEKNKKNISYKRYGFAKAHDIYEELKCTPIENLLLLEKTLGIGYANQLFCYIKDFKDINQINKLEKIINSCSRIPMFARRYITDKICGYLKSFGYSDLSIQYAGEASCLIVSMVQKVYEAILEIYWYAHYWVYRKEDKKNSENIKLIRSALEKHWDWYYNEETVYNNIIESEHIHDWREIDKVEDCFYCWKDKYRIDGINLFDDKKVVFINIRLDDYTEYQLPVQGAQNALGEDILKMTAQRLNEKICFHEKILKNMQLNIENGKKIERLSAYRWNVKPVVRISRANEIKEQPPTQSPSNIIKNEKTCQKEKVEDSQIKELYKEIEENNKELYDLYYEIRTEEFDELKENEKKIWENKDIKIGAMLKPLQVYALVHADIVSYLNH
ncbi:MAG: hypothetical protein HFJ01_09495 [Lachnospiraceae bacterium]|jgi:hypothetical protein|nr:hypothetical protein [Lachnospiraceae bacterium]